MELNNITGAFWIVVCALATLITIGRTLKKDNTRNYE